MKIRSTKVVSTLAFCSVAALVNLIACSDDDSSSPGTAGSSGEGGKGGDTAGAGGKGGSAGSSNGGKGGTAGAGGKGGSGGTSAGSGGQAAAGSGGVAGSAGSGNAGGEGGYGGDPIVVGEGGSGGDPMVGEGGKGGDTTIVGEGGAGGATDPGPVSTNVALGKPATASSEEAGNGVAKGNDGFDNTRWCAANGTYGQWFKVDLGAGYNLTGSEIVWERDDGAYKYKIEVSPNDVDWTMAKDQTGNTTITKTNTDEFLAQARYVRVTVTDIAPNWIWASFFEFRVMGY